MRSVLLFIIMYTSLPAFANERILVLGDSLSAGYGISREDSWVSLLQDKLKSEFLSYEVINASVSGATSSDGNRQFRKLLINNQPKILVLALGSNDGLRGQPVINMRNNLAEIIETAQDNDVQVLLIGFKLPINYGHAYRQQFEKAFAYLHEKYETQFVPFLLEGFAEDLKYFQRDQMHPTSAAQPLILNTVWKYLQPIL